MWYRVLSEGKNNGQTAIIHVATKSSWLDYVVQYHLVVSIDDGPYQYYGSYTKSMVNSGEMQKTLEWMSQNPEEALAKIEANNERAKADHEKQRQEWEDIWVDGYTKGWGIRRGMMGKDKVLPSQNGTSTPTVSQLINSSKAVHKGNTPRGIQALDKKIGRGDEAYKGLKATQENVNKIIDGVMKSKKRVDKPNRNQQGKKVMDYFDPDTKRGIRTIDGKFDTFINYGGE